MSNSIQPCSLLFLFCLLLMGSACTQKEDLSPTEDHTIVVPKEIFAKDKSYVYRAKMYDGNDQLLSNEQIHSQLFFPLVLLPYYCIITRNMVL